MELFSVGVLRSLHRLSALQVNLRYINKRCIHCSVAHRQDASEPQQRVPSPPKTKTKAEVLSRAMKLYMERAEEYNKKMQTEIEEFEIGKKHLANIMGMDPDNFTQKDIDKAIEYLFPSGLTDKKARPMMKHPMEWYPKVKAAQFAMDGRPHHFLFYTGKPNYYQLLHDMAAKLERLDLLMKKQRTVRGDKSNKLANIRSSEWINLEALQKITDSNVTELDHNQFVVLGDRLCRHTHAHKELSYIMQYRKDKRGQTQQIVPEVKTDEAGRTFQESKAKRKKARATVRVYEPGSGQISINGQDLGYFANIIEREQIFFPLQVAEKVGKVDIVADVVGGGPMGQAGAVRLGISRSLRTFVSKEVMERMRLAGLLTTDPRVREKKKYGQPGARKKPTWKRR